MTVKILLLILIGISASLAITADIKGIRKMLFVFKPLSTILIICLATVSYSSSLYFAFVLSALCLSLIGDIALMFKSDKAFLIGLVSFLLAHILYGSIFFRLASSFSLSHLYILLSIILLNTFVYVFLYPSLGNMKLPVLFYVLIISFMLWRAFCILVDEVSLRNILISLGALFFFISDLLLAYDKFKKEIKLLPLYNLATYFTAQSLFAISVFYFA